MTIKTMIPVHGLYRHRYARYVVLFFTHDKGIVVVDYDDLTDAEKALMTTGYPQYTKGYLSDNWEDYDNTYFWEKMEFMDIDIVLRDTQKVHKIGSIKTEPEIIITEVANEERKITV